MFFLSACYNDNEEDVYEKFNTELPCDTIDVNYSENIKSIFEKECVSCHGASHPTCKLDNYINARNYALQVNTNLYTVVSDNDHKGRFLSPCELKQIKLWIQYGAQ